MSGHSLGEYSALVCSGSIKFSDALKILFLRGKLMKEMSIKNPSLMHAIIGIEKKKVQTACLMSSKDKKASLASINSYDQIVISGDESAVREASIYCKNLGAKRIFNLNINIPAHSSLMRPITKKFAKALDIITIDIPKIPVINNVDVKNENSIKKIKQALIRQIYSTVRWQEIIDLIKEKKIFTMIEIGPNKILTNLNKKDKSIISFSTDNLKNFLMAFKNLNTGNNN